MEVVEEIEMDRDEPCHDHAGTSRTGESHKSHDHDCTDDDRDHSLPDADNCQGLLPSPGVRLPLPGKENALPV